VPDEPAAHDDAGPSAPRPAVHVDEAAHVELGVDLVENRDETVARRHGEVANRHVDVAGRRLHEGRVRLELAGLRQVEEERDACVDEPLYLGASVLGAPGTRMASCDEPPRLDDGRRTHAPKCAAPRYLVRGRASQTASSACR
jgi:hypothetical protein